MVTTDVNAHRSGITPGLVRRLPTYHPVNQMTRPVMHTPECVMPESSAQLANLTGPTTALVATTSLQVLVAANQER